MSDSSLSVGEAVGRWFLQVIVFIAAGGLAAGTSTVVYESVAGAENPVVLYGIVFAGGGWIAYQLSRRVLG